MLLSVAERILLLNVIPPAEGDFLFLRAVRTFREALGFTEDEAAAIDLVRADGAVRWTTEKAAEKEIVVGPVVAAYISKSITSAPSLKEQYFEFYSRFVLEDK